MEHTDKAVVKVLERMTSTPALDLVFYRILQFCKTPRTAHEIESELGAYAEIQSSVYTPLVLLQWMDEAGGVAQIAQADTEPVRWQTTPAGCQAMESEAPAKRLAELLSDQPAYRDLFIDLIRFCEQPRSRSDIERRLEGHPALEQPKVYPSYLIQELESAGALEWAGQWQTTPVGKGVPIGRVP